LAPDPKVIAAKLATIEEALGFLEEMAALDYETFVADRRNYRAAERYLHLACEAVFEIGTHLIASLGLARPERYADVLPVLRQSDIVTTGTATALQDLAGFRNLLVHEYGRIDHRRVHGFIRTRLDDLRGFARDVAVFAGGQR
jgi:uncharacterized protein YutE (UPF0331/DUF86 family)